MRGCRWRRELRGRPLTEHGAEMAAARGMIERLNAGGRRAREASEKGQALAAGAKTEE